MKKLFSTLPVLQGEGLTLRPLTQADADDLKEMTQSEAVYLYLPTFLFEKKYDDIAYVIDHLYDECLEDSLILGVFCQDDFCGLAEMYAYRPAIKKISIGVRLIEKYWGSGVASEALKTMEDFLLSDTEIESIAASTMTKNKAAGNVPKQHGFKRVAHGVYENWGFDKPTVSDVWMRTGLGYRIQKKSKQQMK